MFDKKQDGEFTKKEQKGIEKISDKLEPDEKVLQVAIQITRRPGGSFNGGGSNIFFITSLRIIIYNPSLFGVRKDIETFSFDSIVDVRLQKGVFSSSISLIIPGLTEMSKGSIPFIGQSSGFLSGLSKEKGEIFINLIKEKIKDAKQQNKTTSSDNVSDDSLKILKNRYAKGEITKKEFEDIKKDLE